VPTLDEKRVSSSRKASDEPVVIEKEDAKNATAKRVPKTKETVSSPTQAPSAVSDFKLNLPPTPSVDAASEKDPILTEPAREQQATARADSPVLVASQSSHTTRPESASSSDSKADSRGSSLKLTSTKATTPPRTPVEKIAEAAPAVEALSPQKESPNGKTEEIPPPTSIKAAPILPQPQLPSSSPLPLPESSSNLKSIEAFPQVPPASQPTDPKPTLNIQTTTTSPLPASSKLIHRPSFENDTPISPAPAITKSSTTPNATSSSTNPSVGINRLSTAPPSSSSSSKPDKRKSRLSRFLSVSSSTKDTKDKERRKTQQGFGSAVTVPAVLVEEEEKGAVMGKGKVSAEGKGKEVGIGKEKTSWEKEVEKVEGRKWREEGDNESLFCY
jgi:hypothetical protein